MPARLAALALLVAPFAAAAFQDPGLFDTKPTAISAGGGSVHFTGSPAGRGFSCAVCHQGPAGGQQLGFTTEPAELAGGTWKSGVTYKIRVVLANEANGLDHPRKDCAGFGASGPTCNWNGVAVELADDDGNPIGVACPGSDAGAPCDADARMILGADKWQVFGSPSVGGGDTAWTFTWKAPADGSGGVHFYAAAVDGDGGGGADGKDPLRDGRTPDIDGDTVVTLAAAAYPPGVSPPAPAAARTCGLGGGLPAVLGLAFAFALRRRRG